MGWIAFSGKLYEDAVDGYARAIELGAGTENDYKSFVVSLASTGRFDEAMAAAQTAIKRWPENRFLKQMPALIRKEEAKSDGE